jgi:predicted nucleic acid-binding protein
MPPGSKPLLALDTNVLFDLADRKEFAEAVLEILQEQKATVKVSPTVLLELEYELEHPASPEKAKRAERAFRCFRTWDITPFTLAPVQHAIAKEFSKRLQGAQLLPDVEFHDGCILAEAALWPVEFLVTSDIHLLSIDREKLRAHFKAQELPVVDVVSARNLFARTKLR